MDSKFMKPASVVMTLLSLIMVVEATQLNNPSLIAMWSLSSFTWMWNIKLWGSK